MDEAYPSRFFIAILIGGLERMAPTVRYLLKLIPPDCIRTAHGHATIAG